MVVGMDPLVSPFIDQIADVECENNDLGEHDGGGKTSGNCRTQPTR